MQNLSASINVADLNLPDGVMKIFHGFLHLLDAVQKLLPQIPAFDIRAQLVIMALAVPLFLEMIFVWFILPFEKVFYHVLDLLVMIVLSMITTEKIYDKSWNGPSICILIIGITYLILRLILSYTKRKRKYWDLPYVTQSICNHYMAFVIPGVKTTMTTDDLNDFIRSFSSQIEVSKKQQEPDKRRTIITGLIILGFLVFSLWGFGALPWEYPSNYLLDIAPWITSIIGSLMLVVLCMKYTECGKSGVLWLKQFIKRWGLRVLMFFLDMLYIPILTNLIVNITPTKFTCGEGNYLSYDRTPSPLESNFLFEFVNHTAECRPCSASAINMNSACVKACSGIHELRLRESINLLFVDDVLIPAGGIIGYVCIFVMIGIPLLWGIVVKRNRTFVDLMNVYGRNVQDKWSAIVHRLKTTGIFLFQYYKSGYSYWSLWLFFVKSTVMVITTITNRVNKWVIVALPVFYFIVVILNVICQPYLYKANNVLDIMLYVINCMFSIIPAFSTFGYTINSVVATPLTIAMFVIPFISLIVMICFKHPAFYEDDPTLSDKHRRQQKLKKGSKATTQIKMNKEQEEKWRHLEEELNRIEEMLDNLSDLDIDLEMQRIADETSDSRIGSVSVEMTGNGSMKHKKKANTLDAIREATSQRRNDILSELRNECGIDQDPLVTIKEGYMDSIQSIDYADRWGFSKTEEFEVGRRRIMIRVTKMYRTLDRVIDGSTFELVTDVLNMTMLFAAVAFGWYLGGIHGALKERTPLFCG